MLVRLLLRVAEEMTSLSRIFRGIQVNQIQTNKIEIQLRNQFVQEQDDVLNETVHVPTMAEVMEERDRLLHESMQQIEQQRVQFEQYQAEQMQAVEQLKLLWEEEKLQLQQDAYNEAFSQGYEEGIQKASSSMEETLQVVNETIELAKENADKYIEDQEQVILHLAMNSAEKIIGLELHSNEETYISIVRRALKEVREFKNIKVYVAAQYYSLVSKYRDELAEMFPPDVQFLVFVNEDLNELESYIETNHGRVIVSIDSQLQQLRLKLSEILDSKEWVE
jgi:flagellar assembly protein FliH